MNNVRRRAIEKIAEQLSELKDELEALKDEEQEAFDNMPESLQRSERGEAIGGFRIMTIKEKLTLIQEMETRNAEQIQDYMNAKGWKVGYAFVNNDGVIEEDNNMILYGNAIIEVIKEAEHILRTVAPDYSWQKWMIWDVGILADMELF